jgi:Cft2 family RNA processing exonuclease
MWLIRYGATEIVYAMNINLRKETVVESAALDRLPLSPALLIMDGGSNIDKTTVETVGSTGSSRKKKSDRNEDFAKLIASLMDTLRGGGSVIIPCESAGRALEFIQILGQYWTKTKGLDGNYHLAFLSHMSVNIMEFARSQLEWMNDALSKDFYNGRPNPFDIKCLRLFTSVRDLERKCPGPKVNASNGILCLCHIMLNHSWWQKTFFFVNMFWLRVGLFRSRGVHVQRSYSRRIYPCRVVSPKTCYCDGVVIRSARSYLLTTSMKIL